MGSVAGTELEDAVARFCEASRGNDVDAMIDTLSPDAELVSPLFGRMVFRGRQDLRVLLAAVYRGLSDLTWQEIIGDGSMRVAVSEARVAGVPIADAMVFELDADGQIRRLRPHLRPLLGIVLFALLLGPRIARHPGVALRALRRRPNPEP